MISLLDRIQLIWTCIKKINQRREGMSFNFFMGCNLFSFMISCLVKVSMIILGQGFYNLMALLGFKTPSLFMIPRSFFMCQTPLSLGNICVDTSVRSFVIYTIRMFYFGGSVLLGF